jgi:hypothetical protein
LTTDHADSIERIAREAIVLTSNAHLVEPRALISTDQRSSAAALARLGRLLELQTNADDDATELLGVVARIVVQTWITGHATLLLGPAVADDLDEHERATRALVLGSENEQLPHDSSPSLLAMARRLDAHVYGATDPPRAFQRHVRSFYDEIDITGVEGTRSRFAEPTGTSPASRTDHLRVSLWVVLFLAHDLYAAIGARDEALAARMLFDRLRRATAAFYERLRQERSGATT